METITAADMQAAQILTMVTLATWIGAKYLGGNTRRIRMAVLVLYLVGAVGLLLNALLR